MDAKERIWWGRFSVPLHGGLGWRIGPFELGVFREDREYRIHHFRGEDPLSDVLSAAEPREDVPECPEEWSALRFALGEAGGTVLLEPAGPDRTVVSRPETPLGVLPGERVDLYVSTPLWVRVYAGEAALPIVDLPSVRISDTWFGRDTREGMLCYATRTAARLHLDNLPLRPHRAVTKVTVENRASAILQIERLNLPMPSLGLFSDAAGHLWTASVTIRHEERSGESAVSLGTTPGREAGEANPISEPRESPHKGLLQKGLGALLG